MQLGQPDQHNSMQPCWGAETHTPPSVTHTGVAIIEEGLLFTPILRLLSGCHGAALIAPLNTVQDGSQSGTIGMAPLSPSITKGFAADAFVKCWEFVYYAGHWWPKISY